MALPGWLSLSISTAEFLLTVLECGSLLAALLHVSELGSLV